MFTGKLFRCLLFEKVSALRFVDYSIESTPYRQLLLHDVSQHRRTDVLFEYGPILENYAGVL